MTEFDQARFKKEVTNWMNKVMNWIIEASAMIVRDEADAGDRKRIADARDACWEACAAPMSAPEPESAPAKTPSRQSGKPGKIPTLGSKLSSAEICRANGWVVGDILTTTDLDASTLCVRITGIGETHIFVRRFTSLHGECGTEYVLPLDCRDWYRLPQPGDVTEKPENSDTPEVRGQSGKPVLWAVQWAGDPQPATNWVFKSRLDAVQLMTPLSATGCTGTVVPLYKLPPLALTDEETAMLEALLDCRDETCTRTMLITPEWRALIRGLLARRETGT